MAPFFSALVAVDVSAATMSFIVNTRSHNWPPCVFDKLESVAIVSDSGRVKESANSAPYHFVFYVLFDICFGRLLHPLPVLSPLWSGHIHGETLRYTVTHSFYTCKPLSSSNERDRRGSLFCYISSLIGRRCHHDLFTYIHSFVRLAPIWSSFKAFRCTRALNISSHHCCLYHNRFFSLDSIFGECIICTHRRSRKLPSRSHRHCDYNRPKSFPLLQIRAEPSLDSFGNCNS